MYPTISFLIKDWFGVDIPLPIKTFGFFLALSFVLGYLLLRIEMKRRHAAGLIPDVVLKVEKGKRKTVTDFISAAFWGFILGYKLLYAVEDYADFTANTETVLFSLKGSFLGGIVGAIGWVAMAWFEDQKLAKETPGVTEEKVGPHVLLGNIIMVAAVSGIIGAKVFDILEHPAGFLSDPLGTVFSASGLTYYGGAIFGAIAVLYYTRKNGIPVWQMADAGAPALLASYGFGRIACQLSGDGDWGIVNTAPKPGWLSWAPDWMWGYTYPHNVYQAGNPMPNCEGLYCYELAEPVYPTPFYETLMVGLLFIILWQWRKKLRVPGTVFAVFMVFSGIERLLIESIRHNETYEVSGYAFTQAQLISVLFILGGVFLYYRLVKRNKSGEIPLNT